MKKKDKTIGVSATLLTITGAVISWIAGRKYSSPHGVFAIFVIMGLYFIFIGQWFIKIPVNERETLHIWWHLNTKNWEKKCKIWTYLGLFAIFCGVLYSFWHVFVSSERAFLVTLSIWAIGLITAVALSPSERTEDQSKIKSMSIQGNG